MAGNIFDPNYGTKQPEVLLVEPQVKDETTVQGGLANIVDINSVDQIYVDGKKTNTVFKNFTMNLPDIPDRGQFITIMGTSGCGKSTLLRYIAGLQNPTSGEVLIKGLPRNPQISVPMVFQQYSNFEWKSVLHNVTLPLELQKIGKKEAEERAMQMLKIVGLEAHADKYAKYPNLSGGQLQRVAIARSLVENPTILLMDEPFGALDVKTRREMQLFLRSIFEAQSDMTVILVTHSESEAVFLSDKVIVLNANPATIVADIQVDLPLKRGDAVRDMPEFEHYVSQVRKALN
ncbi:MAG: ABC transporter ATP-binding protein [Candidatus Peribacteria bacterium]|jgi:NitT/TauT family transport system ATP-binding protein|nr:ABC transporter ATP-binding protein [Candidatus Peribacteria bacterium]